jgi:uncharacterized membrane protein
MDFLVLFSVALAGFLFFGALLGILSFVRTQRLEQEIRSLRRLFEYFETRRSQPAKAAKTVKPKRVQAAVNVPVPQAKPTQAKPIPTLPPLAKKPIGPGFSARVEQSLRGNWLIWVAGIALALGGVFIVQYAAESGWLGPKARIGIALLAGAAMLGFAHYLRSRMGENAALRQSLAPPVLAAAGLVTLYGAIYAAFSLYHLIGGGFAFALLAAIAALALYEALVFGPVIAVFGLIGAFAAPLLIGSDDQNALTLFGYVFVVSAGGLALARMRPWRWNAILALAGGLGWPALYLLGSADTEQFWVLQLYLPTLVAMTCLLGWNQAVQFATWNKLSRPHLSVSTALFTFFAAALLLLWIIAMTDHEARSLAAMAALGLLAVLVSWKREGFAPSVPLLALFAAITLASWPVHQAGIIDAGEQLQRFLGRLNAPYDGPPFLTACFAASALFGFGGYLGSLGHQRRALMVSAAALFPSLALFIAYWRLAGLEADWPYAAAALAISLVILLVLERESKADHRFADHPGVGASFGLGVSAAVLLIFMTLFAQMWLSLALAGQALVTALLWRRFHLPALKVTAIALALTASFRLLAMGEAFDMQIGSWPILNSLLFGLGGSAALLAAAVWVFVDGKHPKTSRTVQSLSSSAITIAVAMVSLQIHHLLAGGDIHASIEFAETGLQISLFAAIALLVRWRLGPVFAFAPKWTERIAFFLSAFGFVFVAGLVSNPWWGWSPETIEGGILFNSLLLVYLLPASLFAGQAWVQNQKKRPLWARWTGALSILGLFVWSTLEVRHGFHGAKLASGAMSDPERYTYSAVWLVFALVLLSFGFLRKRESLRLGGLALLALTSAKVFVFDLAGLDGLLRGLSFLGLGASLMGIGLLYQKLGPPSASKPETKP